MSPAAATVLHVEPLMLKDASWTTLVRITYVDPLGKERTWESAERLTRPKGSVVDGVGIVAILDLPSGPQLLLQKQFRPPVGLVTIEVPAGLVDEGEAPVEAALRELKEETGYVAEVPSTADDGGRAWAVSPVMFNDPGFCNTNLQMVHVVVDMTRPENQNPTPELEEDEFIECFSVPLTDLYAQCKRLEEEGYAIDARVATIAEGIELAKRWKLT